MLADATCDTGNWNLNLTMYINSVANSANKVSIVIRGSSCTAIIIGGAN